MSNLWVEIASISGKHRSACCIKMKTIRNYILAVLSGRLRRWNTVHVCTLRELLDRIHNSNEEYKTELQQLVNASYALLHLLFSPINGLHPKFAPRNSEKYLEIYALFVAAFAELTNAWDDVETRHARLLAFNQFIPGCANHLDLSESRSENIRDSSDYTDWYCKWSGLVFDRLNALWALPDLIVSQIYFATTFQSIAISVNRSKLYGGRPIDLRNNRPRDEANELADTMYV